VRSLFLKPLTAVTQNVKLIFILSSTKSLSIFFPLTDFPQFI
jgi:hypothetical protein